MFLVIEEDTDTVAANFYFHAIPFSGHRVETQRTDTHKLIRTHISRAHQVKVVLQSAFDTYHIAVEAVVIAETRPDLYLFGIFRGTGFERERVVLPFGVAE